MTFNPGRWVNENSVANLEDYRKLFERAGYRDVTVVDSTEQSWKSFQRHMA